jgi:hypothetical protein
MHPLNTNKHLHKLVQAQNQQQQNNHTMAQQLMQILNKNNNH